MSRYCRHPDVDAVDLENRIALMSDDTEAPITNMLDKDGNETADLDAVTRVVIKLAEDAWLPVAVKQDAVQ